MINDSVLMNQMGNATSISDLAQLTNTAVGGLAGISVWLMVIFVVFIALKIRNTSTESAFVSSFFVGFIVSMLLKGMSLIPDIIFYTNIVALAIAVCWLYIKTGD